MLNLVEGINIRYDRVNLQHLQFTNDTLVHCPNNEEYLINYRRLLDLFSVISSLHINYNKSALISFGCKEAWVEDIRSILVCMVIQLPIMHLGIPLGENPRKLATQQPILNKIEKRLALWKAKLLQKVGRLMLIKSVLNTLLLYYLSLFKIPKMIAQKIISIQREFFWFLSERQKGILLVSWDLIQKPKEIGGIGVGDLVIKNATTLFKWWSRFFDRGDTLQKRIIRSNHGALHVDLVDSHGPTIQGSLWNQILDLSSLRNMILITAQSWMW